MSWIARSFASSLRIDDGDDDDAGDRYLRRDPPEPAAEGRESEGGGVEEREREDGRGMKEDLTEFRETLTRQLWGVANFLAPPPQHHHSSAGKSPPEFADLSVSGDEGDDSSSVHARISSARSDHSEIMNRRNSDHCYGDSSSFQFSHRIELQNVNENGDDFDDDDDDDEDDGDDDEGWISQAVGLTDEVLAFAGNIAHHPETWLDYPIEDEEDFDDFPMSESQKRHAEAIEHLTPRLAALRIELCPAHMSVGFFWKVYFVLLHSRLNKQDADLLSTPEVVEARAKWMQELQKRAKKESERYQGGHFFRGSADLDEDFTPRSLTNEHSETLSSWTFASEPTTSTTAGSDTSDTDKPVACTEMQFLDKSLNDEKTSAETDDKSLATSLSRRPLLNFDDEDDDDWPEDDCLAQNAAVIPVGIDEDVSFSDLEDDDDDCCIPVKSKP